MGAVKVCYERALKRNPNLSGKVKIRWTITAAGTVSASTSTRTAWAMPKSLVH